MSELVTASEIAAALGVSKTSVMRRATRECWPYTTRPVRGGQQHVFDPTALPRALARKLGARQAIVAMKAASATAGTPMPDVFVVVVCDEVFEVRRLGA